MDINFHYFAVKTLARLADYSDGDSQIFAAYSQFVDDYDLFSPFVVRDVPEYAKDLAYPLSNNTWLFYPVTTGFSSWFDFARLTLYSNQVEVVAPFHFVPVEPLAYYSDDDPGRGSLRTIPAYRNVNSLISNYMQQCVEDIKSHPNDVKW